MEYGLNFFPFLILKKKKKSRENQIWIKFVDYACYLSDKIFTFF